MHDEMDILKEVGNIAAAHGSIALSEIFKRKIELAVPHTTIVTPMTIHTEMKLTTGIAVFSTIITGFAGKVIFLLDEKNAFKLNDMSYKLRPEDKKAGILTELGMSLIKEIGNMVTSAYVTALGSMFKRIVLLSPPTLIAGMVDEILNITIFPSMGENKFLLIEAMFLEPVEGLKGSFYLVLTPEAAAEINQLCKRMLQEFSG